MVTFMIKLLCPVCKNELNKSECSFTCENGHCFDMAKEGYVNLLTGSKPGNLIGDNRDMARSRKNFLDKGYFKPLADSLCEIINGIKPSTVLDICCGEGYYTQLISESCKTETLGFDISKEMVRLAAKRKCSADFFVANMADIPLADNSIDCAVHLFAPLNEKEFARITSDDGYLISVCPGENHLWELKSAMYDKPYKNEEIAPKINGFTFENAVHTRADVELECREDIEALFKMTPYYYHTSEADKQKLFSLDTLTTQTDFYIRIYRRG